MDDLAREMYQEHILEHYKHPHNFGELADATHTFNSSNPLCGDTITLQVKVENGIITDARFKAKGCAISVACASLLTDKIKGMEYSKAVALSREEIIELLQIPIGPVRMKCALLPLRTLQKGETNVSPD